MGKFEIIKMENKEIVYECDTLKECRKWGRENNCHTPKYYARKKMINKTKKYQHKYSEYDCIDQSDISNFS